MGRWDHLESWDQQVLTALAAGDVQRALDTLIVGYQHAVVGYCVHMLGDPAEGEEVAQEVFLAAYRTLPTFRQEASVRTWVFAIARKQCWKHLRKRTFRSHRSAAYSASIRDEVHPDPPGPADGELLAAEQTVRDQHLRARLGHCLQQLKKRERDLVMRYYYTEEERVSLRVLAQQWWVSETTIRRRLAAAIAQLRGCLQRGI